MENENILTFFSVIFLTGFFLILPVYAQESPYFYLLTPDEFGPNELISGTLAIPDGVYSQTDKITLSIGSDSEERELKDLLEDYGPSSSYYSASGSLSSDASGTDFTVGILFQKDSTLPEDPQFSFRLSPLTTPVQEPQIDIGKDGIDWINPGVPRISYLPAQGITSIESTEEERITLNCERLFTPKTMEIKLKAYVKTTQNAIPYVSVYDKDLNSVYDNKCKGTVSSDFFWLECNITSEEVFDTGYYYFCLSSGISANKIKTTTDLKEGYSQCQPDGECIKLGYDYLINIQSLSHNADLSSEQLIELDQDGLPLISKIADYLQNCIYTKYNTKEYCVIPINIKSGDTNELKISGISLDEQTSVGTGKIISKVVTNLKQESGAISLYDAEIDLKKFSLNAPSSLNKYKLKAEFKSYSDEKEIAVIPKPIAVISLSNLLAPGEQAVFSAEGSSSPDNSPLTYNWTFSDNTSFTTQTVTKSFAKSGKYKVTLIVKDAKGRLSTPKTEEITVSTLISRAPLNFQEVKYSFDNAYDYYQSSPKEIKDVYTDLGLDTFMQDSKTALDDYESNLNTSEQLPSIDDELSLISEKTPRLISVQDSLTIKPYLTYADISLVYPAEQEESKLAIENINEKIGKEFTAKLVKISYINATPASFVLVKKIFTAEAPLEKVFVKEVLPSALSVSQLTPVKETPEVVDQKTLNYRFDSLTDEISLVYLLDAENLLSIPKIITILTPEDMNIKMIAFDCPNSVCNPAEDYLSCPEDCTCGNNKCDKGETSDNCPEDCSRFPWTAFIITIIIILLAGAVKILSVFKPGYITSLKPVQKFMAMLSIRQKIPFSSNESLAKLVTYIKSAKSKNISEKEIKNALAKKGWSEKQINFAFMRSK